MSQFHSLLNRAYRTIITEQEQPPVQVDAQAQPMPAPEQAAPTPVPEIPEQQPPEEEIEKLSPEGMVYLIKLIGKSLMIQNLDPDEERKIVEFLSDMNEVNAQKALDEFLPIIQRYAPSVESIPKV
jgi:hypothetical protein